MLISVVILNMKVEKVLDVDNQLLGSPLLHDSGSGHRRLQSSDPEQIQQLEIK